MKYCVGGVVFVEKGVKLCEVCGGGVVWEMVGEGERDVDDLLQVHFVLGKWVVVRGIADMTCADGMVGSGGTDSVLDSLARDVIHAPCKEGFDWGGILGETCGEGGWLLRGWSLDRV